MNENDFALVLWNIYLQSCVCHMDHGSQCTCEANDLAADALKGMFGERWHDIMRHRTRVCGCAPRPVPPFETEGMIKYDILMPKRGS